MILISETWKTFSMFFDMSLQKNVKRKSHVFGFWKNDKKRILELWLRACRMTATNHDFEATQHMPVSEHVSHMTHSEWSNTTSQ